MSRTILIVDDNAINRHILMAVLSGDYNILEASDGREALSLIEEKFGQLSAVLLDIQMPVMDGYEVLRVMRGNPVTAHLPVIVVTASSDEITQRKALELGANDFVSKPFNPEIIKHCLMNNISLYETASIINNIQKDKLTGIFNREFFFEKAKELVSQREPGHYMLVCFDIDHFKLVNDQYGALMGDRILAFIGREMQTLFEHAHGLCGRITGDNFAGIFPNVSGAVEALFEKWDIHLPDTALILHLSIGCCAITDLNISISALYDRAYIAKQSVKGRYDKHIAYFDDSMMNALVREQEIVLDMDQALANNEFEAWFQPQYNHATGALIGAEALARWRHATKGLISPAEFIPIFEKNGFVYELDKAIWEQTCRCLRKWIDEGDSPLPISVNISRYDILRDDLPDVIAGLVLKYSLPVELLRLEVTESAFSESSETIIHVVKRLIGRGFTVEIDDFGSGYSSLNTLKDVPAQIIKLDMRFLKGGDKSQRSGYILESVVRMARWLNTAVIAEGVETVEQADFLKSIGCNYVQGYLYKRPMPMSEYESLIKNGVREERLITLETVEHLDCESFWTPSSMDTLIFNSFVGGACIFEYDGAMIELLRMNDSYVRELGIRSSPGDALSLYNPTLYLDEAEKNAVRACIVRAIESASEQTSEAMLFDGGTLFETPQYIRYTLRVIAKAGSHYLLYCVVSNITPQRMAEHKHREAEQKRLIVAQQLQAILSNIDGGVTAFVNRDGLIEYIYTNDMFYELLSCSQEQYQALYGGGIDFVQPEDRERVTRLMTQANNEHMGYSVEYRVARRDGQIRWLRSNVTLMRFPEIDQPVHLAVIVDITQQAETNEQLKLLNDIARDLLAQPDAQRGLNGILRKCREHMSGDRAYILEFDLESQTANCTYESCSEGVARRRDDLQHIPLDQMGAWLDAFERQDYLIAEDAVRLEGAAWTERPRLLYDGLKSCFAVPLYRDRKLIGMMGVDNPHRQYQQMDRSVAIGDYIAVVLTRRDLNAQIAHEDEDTLVRFRAPRPGLRELSDTSRRISNGITLSRVFLAITLVLCFVLAVLTTVSFISRRTDAVGSFDDPTLTLSDGWTLTDSAGVSRPITLPATLSYGTDGLYTLTRTLPDDLLPSASLCLYSNYVDLHVALDGKTLYTYAGTDDHTLGATGNTYHYIHLPIQSAGGLISIDLRGQLGSGITYLVKAPLLGSKAAMLYDSVVQSMPFFYLSGGMLLVALLLAIVYVCLRNRLELNKSTIYMAAFAALFALYMLCETSFMQQVVTDGYSLFTCTLMFLALIPVPLIGLLASDTRIRFKRVIMGLVILSSLNFVVQIFLHFTGIMCMRVMVTATHAVIVVTAVVLITCLILSMRSKTMGAKHNLISVVPMLAGGVLDIVLLMTNQPSLNNSLWFTIGVTAFTVIQFSVFIRGFFAMYRNSLEANALRNMAYRDTLTDLGNTNAMERKLKELSMGSPLDRLCCIALTICDMAQMTSRYGREACDAAVVETSRVLDDMTPEYAACFHIGGGEFIVILDDFDASEVEALALKLRQEIARRGTLYSVPLNVTVGCGAYEPSDADARTFVQCISAHKRGVVNGDL